MSEVTIILTADQLTMISAMYHAILIVGGCIIFLLAAIAYSHLFRK
jgi:hypothetical protein